MDDATRESKRRQFDAARDAFTTALEPFTVVEELGDVPRLLYHYTTLDGVIGILNDSALWASDVRYMNDSSELSYARELIDEVIRERTSRDRNPYHDLIATWDGLADPFMGERVFVTCFCEDGDLLSQWRGYGAGDVSYALGLNVARLVRHDELPRETFLLRVIYDEAVQRAAIERAVDEWLSVARTLIDDRGFSPRSVFPYPAIWGLQHALLGHHLRFKHPAFSEEREWRLVTIVDVREELGAIDWRRTQVEWHAIAEQLRASGIERDEWFPDNPDGRAKGITVSFRRGRFGLVPYVGLELKEAAGVFTGRLPLEEVVQGPTSHPALSLESMKMYLQASGYMTHTDVRPSSVPLR